MGCINIIKLSLSYKESHVHKFISHIYSFLDTKYNWSLCILTLVIYFILSSSYSSNHNYDMPQDLYHYFIFTNIGILVACIIKGAEKNTHLLEVSVLSLILQILTILAIKSLIIPGVIISIFVPASIFIFLYLLKETAGSVN